MDDSLKQMVKRRYGRQKSQGLSRMEGYGKIHIRLNELIQQSGVSKSKLSHRAEMQRSQINHYCNNRVSRLDIDVLARLCTALDCRIGELLEFVPIRPRGFRGLRKKGKGRG